MMSVIEDDTLLASGFDLEDKKKIAEPYFKGRLQEASDNVKDELLDAFAAVGKTEDVIDRLTEYSSAGVDFPLVLPIKTDSESLQKIIEVGDILAECS